MVVVKNGVFGVAEAVSAALGDSVEDADGEKFAGVLALVEVLCDMRLGTDHVRHAKVEVGIDTCVPLFLNALAVDGNEFVEGRISLQQREATQTAPSALMDHIVCHASSDHPRDGMMILTEAFPDVQFAKFFNL